MKHQSLKPTETPCTIFWKDNNSVFLGCNEQFAKVAGLNSPEEIVGLSDFDLPWKNTEAEYYRSIDKEIFKGCRKLNFAETQRQANGSACLIITSKVPLLDNNNHIIGVLGSSQEIQPGNMNSAYLIVNEASNIIFKDSKPIALSKREIECLCHLVRGKTYKGIANAMSLSINTVKNYFVSIKCKLGVYHRSQLIELALANGL